MKDHELVARVGTRAQFASAQDAQQAVHDVLDLLGRRLGGHEPGELAAQLPATTAVALAEHDGPAEHFGVEEFLERTARTRGVDPDHAREQATAILTTVGEAITGGQLNQVLTQLPAGYAALFGHPELS